MLVACRACFIALANTGCLTNRDDVKSILACAALLLTLSACAQSPGHVSAQVRIIPGTAVGDPCAAERTLVDTPRGYPRLCVNGRWVPYCERADAEQSVFCQ